MKREIVRVTEQGITKAKQALDQNHGGIQTRLLDVAKESGQSLSSDRLTKFFNCRNIERTVAVKIFGLLGLKPGRGDIASVRESENDIDALVQQVRQKRHAKIQNLCGTMGMLRFDQPVAMADIYTDVNILEDITCQQWRDISDLARDFNPESDDFDRLGLSRQQDRLPGLEAVERYSKLMVLGKPGAGKTTFLQWVAIKCDEGKFQPNRVPIFIRLKNFAEDTKSSDNEFRLLNYISGEFADCGIEDESFIKNILTTGRALILFDGLDEVSEKHEYELVKQIRFFAEKYFKNKFIITCRIAAQKYRFQGFTDVEVADFNSEQVETFAKKWFVAVPRNNGKEGEATAKRFVEKLNLLENQAIRELAVTPILLNLTCLVFQAKSEFPSKRSKLYEQGLDILIKLWDESKGIKRDEVYKNLSFTHKNKLLSEVAFITFEQGEYFCNKGKIQGIIADYLGTLPNVKTAQYELEMDSEAVLKSIETQHGILVVRAQRIYSFSHLTFQEYFTARTIVFSKPHLEEPLRKLVRNINKGRWREVFLLVTEILPKFDANYLLHLMKREIDKLVATDDKLRLFLAWVKHKSVSAKVSHKPVKLRAFYLEFGIKDLYPRRTGLSTHLGEVLGHYVLDSNLGLDFALDWALRLVRGCLLDHELHRSLDNARKYAFDAELNQQLQKLQDKLPDPDGNRWEKHHHWWIVNGKVWAEELRSLMLQFCNIGYDWQFSDKQKQTLREYHEASWLLVDCLNTSEVTPEVLQEIEDTLLLPIAEIEKRQQ